MALSQHVKDLFLGLLGGDRDRQNAVIASLERIPKVAYIKDIKPNGTNGGAQGPGISLNASLAQTQAAISVTDPTVALAVSYADTRTANEETLLECSWTGLLNKGDVVRMHVFSGTPYTSSRGVFHICKIGV